MPRPRFEDVYPAFAGGDTYRCTNEEVAIHRALLDKRSFKRTGGVASSGDVLLTTLLPRSGEVIAVDHGYGSLAIAFLKAVILDTLGARAMKALLLEKTHQDFVKVAIDALPKLPEALRATLRFDSPSYPSITQSDYNDIRREWISVGTSTIERSHRRLGNVTFLHGDLSDLAAFGPLDCLYTSNAFEHMSRVKRCLGLKDVSPLVREDGLLLLTSASGNKLLEHPDWQHVKSYAPTRTSWSYRLYRRKVVVPVTPIAPVEVV